jgi:hypothetical protein
MSARPSNILVWFGVLGGALAWAGQHVAGIALGWDRCNPPGGRPVPFHALAVAIAVVGVAIAAAAELVALLIFRATRGTGNHPPVGRIHFLSVVALTVNPLALAIMVLSGVGSAVLSLCTQS